MRLPRLTGTVGALRSTPPICSTIGFSHPAWRVETALWAHRVTSWRPWAFASDLDVCSSRARRNVSIQRSEEHKSELQSLMRFSYAVFCLKKKTKVQHNIQTI